MPLSDRERVEGFLLSLLSLVVTAASERVEGFLLSLLSLGVTPHGERNEDPEA